MLRPVQDTLYILNGRWRLRILISLFGGPLRFNQISKTMNGITDRVLSKELKELEQNQLIKRTVLDTFPPTIEYTVTDHGYSLEKVITAMKTWGDDHRNKIFVKQ